MSAVNFGRTRTRIAAVNSSLVGSEAVLSQSYKVKPATVRSLQASEAARSPRPRPAAESGLTQQITGVIYRMAGGALPLDIGFLVAAFYLLCSEGFNDGKLSRKDDL